jgi:hypothetical protein
MWRHPKIKTDIHPLEVSVKLDSRTALRRTSLSAAMLAMLGCSAFAHAAGVDPADVALRADVTTRIRRVCADMSPDAFDLLVRDICAMKRRWAGRSES